MPAGQSSSSQTVSLTFTSAGSVASQVALTTGAPKQDFTIAAGGTCTTGQSYPVGATCTVSVTFAPLFAGLRSGAVVLQGASGNTLASTYISGVGSGPQPGFHTLGASSSFPYLNVTADKGIAVDGNGNLFVSSTNSSSATDSVVELPAGCTQASCIKQLPGSFHGIWGLALDGAGNLWVGDTGASGTVTEIPASGGYATTKVISGSFGNQIGIAVDGSGNVFFTGYSAGSAYSVTELLAAGNYATAKTLATGYNGLAGLAVDASGNVFFASVNDRAIKELVAVGGSIPASPTVNTIGSSLVALQDVVVEGSGDLLVTTAGNGQSVGGLSAITKYSIASGYQASTVVASGFSAATGIALTSGGDIYGVDINSVSGASVFLISRATVPTVLFRTPTPPGIPDTADGSQSVFLENLGNQPLAVSSLVFSNPSFSFDSSITTCSPTGSLAAGDTCTLGIQFVPVTTGSPVTGTLSIGDNALNAAGATQKLPLTASGLFTPVLVLTPSASVIAVTQTLTIGIKLVGGSGTPVPTGTVQVAAVGYAPAPVPLVNGAATLTLPPGSLMTGTAGLGITYVPDTASSSVYTSAAAQYTVTVTSTLLNVPSITVTPVVPAVSVGQALSVTVSVAPANGAPMPTGTIKIAAVQYVSPATAIVGGTVVLTIPANTLVPGTDQLVATYQPDAASAMIYVAGAGAGFVSVSTATTAPGSTPSDFGTVNIGATSPVTTVTLTFASNSTPTQLVATTQGATGKDFAIVPGGTCLAGVYVAAGQSCTVNVTFTPAFAGLRNGAVVALDDQGQAESLTYIHGSGNGPQLTLQSDPNYAYYGTSPIYQANYPFSTTSVSDGFSQPAVAVDGAGNLFIADLGPGTIKEVPAGCTSASCTVTVLRAFYGPAGIAIDGAGNLFISEVGNGDVKKLPPGCKSSTCLQTIGTGFNYPYGLAVDSSGNVFVADTNNNAVKELVAAGGYSTVKTIATGLDLPWSVALNAAGDIFVAEGGDQCTVFIPGLCSTINTSILQIPAAGGYKTVKTLASGGFGKPFGLAVDGAGNLYEADYGDTCSNEFTAASGYTSSVSLCARSLVQFPESMAIDGADNLFLTDVVKGAVYKSDYVDPPPMNFRTPTLQGVSDGQDGPQIVAVRNNGTVPLTFSSIILSDTSFTFDSLTTCSTSTPLAPGGSCFLAVDFKPTKTGPFSATLTLTDNNLNQSASVQVFPITAVALPPVPVILTTPANPTNATTATFTFSDTQSPSTFVCSLDLLPFAACTSPANYTGLSGGAHVFEVRASDTAGNLSNAAIYNWTVNAVGPPAPVITSAPAYLTNDDTATFAFTDTQAGVTFQCSLDSGAFAACASGVNYSGLAGFANNYTIVTKPHTFAVRAMDASGNFSPQTVRAWTDISNQFSAYPTDFGLQPLGQTSAPQSVTFNFFSVGGQPKKVTVASIQALTAGVTGLDFAVTDPGTCAVGAVLPDGTTCTLKATFTPKYPGQRRGGVLLLDASGKVIGDAYLQGTGTAPQVTFGTYSTSTFSVLAPQNNANPQMNLVAPVTAAAIDGAGSVYVSVAGIASVDGSVNVSSGDVWKFPAGCTDATCIKLVAESTSGQTGVPQVIPVPSDLTLDGSGVLWVPDNFPLGPTILPTTAPATANYYPTPCTYVNFGGEVFSSVAIDGAGDAGVIGGGLMQRCEQKLGAGQTSQTTSFDFSTNTPSVAVDPQNNFFVADTGNNSIKEVLASSGYTVSRTIGSGFKAPAGVASDAYGNIYVSDTGNNAIKEITASSGYTQVITLASFGAKGLTPQHLTLDALGNLYVSGAPSASATSTLTRLDFADAPALSFPTATRIGTSDTADGTLTATLKNNGNQPLTLTGIALSNTNFSLDSSTTTCSLSAPLAPGASCTLGVIFTPNGNGALTGTLTVTDNALNASGSAQVFALSGNAFLTPTTATPSVTVTPSSATITTAQSDTVTVTVAGKAGSATPTGVVSLLGSNYTSPTATLSGGSATFTIAAGVLGVGSTTLNAVYTPDAASSATYGVGAGSTSITVQAIVQTTPTVTVTPAMVNLNTQQSLAVTIAVSDGSSRPVPSGTVSLSGGNFASQAITLTGGSATITVPAGFLPAGMDTLMAYYTPDSVSQPNFKSASGIGQVAVESALKVTPAVAVTPSASSIQPTQQLPVTLRVAAGTGKSTPTGSIVVTSGTYTSAALPLSQGSVSFTIPANTLAMGSDTLTATYTPDAASTLSFSAASGTGTVNVASNPIATATTLQGGPSPVVQGTSVSFSIAVAQASGTVVPTGQVVLMDGSSMLTTLTLNASGTATYATTALSVGVHAITAVYQGNASNTGSTSAPVSITVTAPTVQVTVAATPAGVAFSVDGTAYTSPQTLTWTVGSSHTLATTSPQTSGGVQNTFASWSDGGALTHTVTAPASTATYTAAFSTSYQLTTSANPAAGGTITPSSGAFYAAGATVNLVATPSTGFSFINWSGNVASSTSASTTITMNAAQSVTANFIPLLPVAALTPSTLTFTATSGSTSAAQVATLTNTGNAPLSVTGISLAGTGAAAFSQTNTCGSTLAVSAACTLSVTFSPASSATFAATLTVADSASGSPQTVSLNGTGLAASSFTLSSSSGPQTVLPGGAASFQISVTPVNGAYANAVTLAVSGLPPGATSSFAPATLTPGNSPATSTLTIQTAHTVAGLTGWPLAAPTLALAGLLAIPRRRRRAIQLLLLVIATLGGLAALSGCGGGFAQPLPAPSTYNLTITGSSGAVQQTTTVQLTVQ